MHSFNKHLGNTLLRSRLVLIDNKLSKTRSFLSQDSTPPPQPIYTHTTRYTFQNTLHTLHTSLFAFPLSLLSYLGQEQYSYTDT